MAGEQVDTENHKKISFTADSHPYWRALGEFPFAEDIEKEVKGRESFQRNFGADKASEQLLVLPAFEARYRSTNELIRKYVRENGIRQIMSLAAGMEQRGIEFASSHSDMTYVSTDISEAVGKMSALSDKIFSEHELPNRKGLHFEFADVMSIDQLKKAASHFSSDKPIMVVNEGLMNYYSVEENAKIAKNVNELLTHFGGYWVTPDPSMNEANRGVFFAHAPSLTSLQAKVGEKTGRKYGDNGFKDDASAVSFFEGQGFSVKRYYRKELGYSLITLNKAGLGAEAAKNLDKSLEERFAVWVMSLSNGGKA